MLKLRSQIVDSEKLDCWSSCLRCDILLRKGLPVWSDEDSQKSTRRIRSADCHPKWPTFSLELAVVLQFQLIEHNKVGMLISMREILICWVE